MHAQLKERLLVDGVLPEPIRERLAALEHAERRRSGEIANERPGRSPERDT